MRYPNGFWATYGQLRFDLLLAQYLLWVFNAVRDWLYRLGFETVRIGWKEWVGQGGLNLTCKNLLFVPNVMFEMAFGLCYMDFV